MPQPRNSTRTFAKIVTTPPSVKVPTWTFSAIKISIPIVLVGMTCYVLLQILKTDVAAIKIKLPHMENCINNLDKDQIRIKVDMVNQADKTQRQMGRIEKYLEKSEKTMEKMQASQQEIKIDVKMIQQKLESTP